MKDMHDLNLKSLGMWFENNATLLGLNRYGISLPIRCPMFFSPVSADTDTDPMFRYVMQKFVNPTVPLH